MFLSVVTFVIIAPLIVICGWIIIIKDIANWAKGKKDKDDNSNKPEYIVRHETPEDEERRVEEYGLDNEWGKLK